MRYSSALVLGTVAVSQAANLRHASFHARRQAEASKRDAADEVDWTAISYDLSGVDWSKVFPDSSAAAEAPAATETEPSVAVAAVAASSAATPSVTTVPSSVTTASPTPEQPADKPTLGSIVSDLLQGVEDIISKLGLKGPGVNAKKANDGLWIGDDSQWKTQFTNDGSDDVVLFCWKSNGFSGMSLNTNEPAISVGLKVGESVTVSFAENVPAACAPAYSDTKMALFGGIDNTWYEATFGAQGAFDISRNVNMKGNNISAKGSKCVSDMNTCVFQCADSSAASCETGYQLAGMDAPGCGGGYDSIMQGVGGGCSMGASGETVQVTFT